MALQTAGGVLSVVVSIVLARVLGVENYGVYAYALSLISLLEVLAQMGYPVLLVREVAKFAPQDNWSSLYAILRWASVLTLTLGLVLGAAGVLLGSVAGPVPGSRVLLLTLVFAMAVMILDTQTAIRSAVLRGLKHVAESLVPTALVRPLVMLGGIGALYAVSGVRMDAARAMAIQLSAAAIVVILMAFVLRARKPTKGGIGRRPTSPGWNERIEWTKSGLLLMTSGLMIMINLNADILMLGWLRGPADVAVYQVATRAAQIMVLPLGAIALATQPELALFCGEGRHDALQSLASKITWYSLSAAAPLGLLLTLFGGPLISVLFGAAFAAAAGPLAILAVARVVNAATGALGPYLAMGGGEKALAIAMGVEATLNVALNGCFIPIWGARGAAFATGGSMVVVNLVLAVWVYHRYGVNVGPFQLGSGSRK
jgi:O-antigen/teichoic acid export membrane protein